MHRHLTTLQTSEMDTMDRVVVYEGDGTKIECGCTISVEAYRMPFELFEKMGRPEKISIQVFPEGEFDFNEVAVPKFT